MMMALFPTLKGAARPITTPITTYHHIKHAPATSHKNQVNSLYMYIQLYKIMSPVFLSLPLFPLLLSFSFFLLTFFLPLLADDGVVLVQAAICGAS